MMTVAKEFDSRLHNAIARLMKITPDGDRARVSVPISYPSGSSAAVEIIFNDGNCFVSDFGLGQMEAEMLGADTYYSAAARKAADRFGVGFDGLSIFKTWASIDRIEGAIMAVSNASAFASGAAIYKAAEEKDRQKNDELFERVSHAFGVNNVAKSYELIGRDAPWDAHNVVLLPTGRRAVFEYVSENQNSIASKFQMFSDLSKSDQNYSLTSVVSNLEKLGRKGVMLADVSTIMALSANDDAYRMRAAA